MNSDNATLAINHLTQSKHGVASLKVFLNGYCFMYSAEKGFVSFKFKQEAKHGINYCKVSLNANDEYVIELGIVEQFGYELIEKIDGIPPENMKEFFEERTGCYLSCR